MSIYKIKSLQGKISDKFGVYVSFQFSQGVYAKGRKGYRVSVYDEYHGHREYSCTVSAVHELEEKLAMTKKEFKYLSVKDGVLNRLTDAKEELCEIQEEIASFEEELRKIEVNSHD